MALVKFDLGAEFDVATGDDVASLAKKMEDKREPLPLFFPVTGTINGNGSLIVGRPPLGKLWNLLSITLLGLDDFTTVAGQGALYVDSEPGALSLAQCRLPKLAIPSGQPITRNTLWAHSTGNVIVNVTGTTALPQVVATVTVAEWAHGDVSSTVVW